MGSKAMSRGQGGTKSSPGDSGERAAKTGCAGLEGPEPREQETGRNRKHTILQILQSCLWVRQRMSSHSRGVRLVLGLARFSV